MKITILFFILILTSIIVLAYIPPNNEEIALVLDTGYVPPNNEAITLVLADIPSEDTCTCPSPASEWNIDLTDNCEITSDCDVRPYNTRCYGSSGSLGIYANFYTGNFTCDMKTVYMNKTGVIWITK